MPRAKDLDTIAPDDMEVSAPIPSKKTPKNKTDIATTTAVTTPTIKKTTETIRQNIYEILGHTKSPFSSLLVKPKVISFQERDQDEEIIIALRAHWFTNVSWICSTIFLIFVPSFFKYFPFLNFFPGNYQFITILFWYLITFVFAFEKFLSWYFNVYILTDERVIDIDFNNLLNKNFAEAKISMIQDVSFTVAGLAGTIFNYGTILIQTASEVNQLKFDKVPSPEKVIKVLQQLRQEEELEALEGRIK